MILVAVCLTGAMVADLLIRQPAPSAPENTGFATPLPSEKTDSPKKPPVLNKRSEPVKETFEADHITPQAGMKEKKVIRSCTKCLKKRLFPRNPVADRPWKTGKKRMKSP